ncbi:MAG TPA: polyphosphate kinase 2 family protein [Tepidisphaeraceae bacterium]|jgi:PPK2 family polyphosphate:nucleotide phosphotransferase
MSIVSKFIRPYRVDDGSKFRLKDIDPDDTGGIKSKDRAAQLLKQGVEQLSKMQDKLYADNHWGLLLIFQAMDAAGKDSTIKHVMSGVNPQGCQVYSFKSPSSEELDHDFMWRTNKCLPERGRIGIFNRSYYEEVLVVKVHPQFLQGQGLPDKLITKDIWEERYEDISNFERYLTRNGTAIRKFFLYHSKEEQRRRFLARLEDPRKHWKFALSDLKEREHWDEYMDAYEKMIRRTATEHAPWFVVPADHKWFTRLVVAAAVIDALEGLDLAYPKVPKSQKALLDQARKTLEAEK